MSNEVFQEYTVTSAPPESRRPMEATIRRGGYLPRAVARLAGSPELLSGFLEMSALFEKSTLDPVAREVVIMTIATRNECHICVAMHTAKLQKIGAPAEMVEALRTSTPLAEPRLDVLRRFVLDVVTTAGAVDDRMMSEFLEAGFTVRNALEVVLGIGTYTMSTIANRLTAAPLDAPLEPYAWRAVRQG